MNIKKILFLILIIIFVTAILHFSPSSTTSYKNEGQVITVATSTSSIATSEPITSSLTLSFFPAKIFQGDPVLIVINGTTTTKGVTLTFDGKPIPTFINNNKVEALAPIDLRGKTGNYQTKLTLTDGTVIKQNLFVNTRPLVTATLDIPAKLGGNSASSTQKLISTLVEEGVVINSVKSVNEKLWTGTFRYPLDAPVTVTDVYGYSRQTNGVSISHKGTDFHAATGTPVFAINSGIVKFVGYLRNYGNTVIIDHGTGILSIYMHLSESDVQVGDTIVKGELIAKSGETGYVLGPHLHLTIRIGGVSIDPMKFYNLPL